MSSLVKNISDFANTHTEPHENDKIVCKPIWENEKCDEFINCLNDTDIQNLKVKLESIDIESVDNIVMNSLIEECYSLILQAATNCNFMHEKNIKMSKCKSNNFSNKKVEKPWFN